MKTFAKIVAVFALGLVMTGLVCAVALSTSWGEDAVLKVLQDRLNHSSLTKVSIGEVDDISILWPPGTLTFTAREVDVKSAEGPLLVTLGDVRATLVIPSLLWREVRVTRARANGVELLTDDRGHPLIAGGLGRTRRPRTVGVQVDNLDVQGLYLVTYQASKQMLGRLNAEMSITAPRGDDRILATLKSGSGNITRPVGLEVIAVSGEVDSDATHVADLLFTVRVGKSEVTGQLHYIPTDKKKPLHINVEKIAAGGMAIERFPSLDAIREFITFPMP